MSNNKQNQLLFFLNLIQGNFGISLFSIALAFFVLEQTHSAKQMALTFAFSYLQLFLVPIATTWFDRCKLKIPLILLCVLRAALVLAFVLLLKSPKIFWIYFLAFADSALVTIYNPINQALIPFIFPKHLLNKGNGIYVLIRSGISALGFLLGGVIVAACGPKSAMLIYAINCLLGGLLLAYIDLSSLKTIAENTKKIHRKFTGDFITCCKIIFAHKQLLIIIIAAFFLNTFVFSLFDVQLPFYMTQIGKGANGVGMFNTWLVLGVAFGGLSMAALGSRFKIADALLASLFITIPAFLGLMIATSYPILLCFVFLLGFATGIYDCCGLLYVQKTTPLAYMAGMNGLQFVLVQIGKPIFLFLGSGLIAKFTMNQLYLFGVIISIATIIVWLTNENMRNITSNREENLVKCDQKS